MEPGFTQEDLDKVKLSVEDLEYYSKPDEIKRILLERNFYKLSMEKQIEKNNNASAILNSILDSPISITKKVYTGQYGNKKTLLISKSARDLVYEYRLNKITTQLFLNKNIDFSQYDNILNANSN